MQYDATSLYQKLLWIIVNKPVIIKNLAVNWHLMPDPGLSLPVLQLLHSTILHPPVAYIKKNLHLYLMARPAGLF